MYVVIVGAGEVGSTVAESLADTHDVAVIDIDGSRVDTLNYSIDVLGIEGDGMDLDTLRYLRHPVIRTDLRFLS